jgi:hypothetical protein
MTAPKLFGDAVLGGHHLYVTPRTMTGIIRTTARKTMLRKDNAEKGRSFEMATAIMVVAAKKVTGCRQGSQSVKLILLLIEITFIYV